MAKSRPNDSLFAKFVIAFCDDAASMFVLFLNLMSFTIIALGIIFYFQQYSYNDDTSDEKWIYPFIWFIPSFGFGIGCAIHFFSSISSVRGLFWTPFLVLVQLSMLGFLAYIFLNAFQSQDPNNACGSDSSKQDVTCLVMKDGKQVCGHEDISSLCLQIQLGFYLVFMGCILMAGTQILFVTTGCVRRNQLKDTENQNSSYKQAGSKTASRVTYSPVSTFADDDNN